MLADPNDFKRPSLSQRPYGRRKAHSPPSHPPTPPEGTTRFLLTEYEHTWENGTLLVLCTSDIPIHLTLCWTHKRFRVHQQSVDVGGMGWSWDPYYCFVECTPLEQNEPGDTLEHTWDFNNWLDGECRYWIIYGDVAGLRSPSCSAIFTACYEVYQAEEELGRYVEDIGKHDEAPVLTDHVKLEEGSGIMITRIDAHNSLRFDFALPPYVASLGKYDEEPTLVGQVKLEEGANIQITLDTDHNSLKIATTW